MEKLNLTQQKHTFTDQQTCNTTQNKHKKTKAGVVTSYDIWPGNREGLLWFWHFINLSLTHLQPRDPHGAVVEIINLYGVKCKLYQCHATNDQHTCNRIQND